MCDFPYCGPNVYKKDQLDLERSAASNTISSTKIISSMKLTIGRNSSKVMFMCNKNPHHPFTNSLNGALIEETAFDM